MKIRNILIYTAASAALLVGGLAQAQVSIGFSVPGASVSVGDGYTYNNGYAPRYYNNYSNYNRGYYAPAPVYSPPSYTTYYNGYNAYSAPPVPVYNAPTYYTPPPTYYAPPLVVPSLFFGFGGGYGGHGHGHHR